MKEPESDNEQVFGGTASSRHCAEVRVRGKQADGMYGKDIRDSEELKSQKQKQSQHQKSMDQTLNAKMKDENNETFTHDTEFHEFWIAVAAGASTCKDGQGGDSELTTTIRKSVNITEYESDKINSNDPILTMTSTKSRRKGRIRRIRSSRRVPAG